MTQKEREDTVSRMRKGESWVMVCTEVMARGMDFKGVREVINYDFPQSVQSYVHRIGMLCIVARCAYAHVNDMQGGLDVLVEKAKPSRISQMRMRLS